MVSDAELFRLKQTPEETFKKEQREGFPTRTGKFRRVTRTVDPTTGRVTVSIKDTFTLFSGDRRTEKAVFSPLSATFTPQGNVLEVVETGLVDRRSGQRAVQKSQTFFLVKEGRSIESRTVENKLFAAQSAQTQSIRRARRTAQQRLQKQGFTPLQASAAVKGRRIVTSDPRKATGVAKQFLDAREGGQITQTTRPLQFSPKDIRFTETTKRPDDTFLSPSARLRAIDLRINPPERIKAIRESIKFEEPRRFLEEARKPTAMERLAFKRDVAKTKSTFGSRAFVVGAGITLGAAGVKRGFKEGAKQVTVKSAAKDIGIGAAFGVGSKFFPLATLGVGVGLTAASIPSIQTSIQQRGVGGTIGVAIPSAVFQIPAFLFAGKAIKLPKFQAATQTFKAGVKDVVVKATDKLPITKIFEVTKAKGGTLTEIAKVGKKGELTIEKGLSLDTEVKIIKSKKVPKVVSDVKVDFGETRFIQTPTEQGFVSSELRGLGGKGKLKIPTTPAQLKTTKIKVTKPAETKIGIIKEPTASPLKPPSIKTADIVVKETLKKPSGLAPDLFKIKDQAFKFLKESKAPVIDKGIKFPKVSLGSKFKSKPPKELPKGIKKGFIERQQTERLFRIGGRIKAKDDPFGFLRSARKESPTELPSGGGVLKLKPPKIKTPKKVIKPKSVIIKVTRKTPVIDSLFAKPGVGQVEVPVGFVGSGFDTPTTGFARIPSELKFGSVADVTSPGKPVVSISRGGFKSSAKIGVKPPSFKFDIIPGKKLTGVPRTIVQPKITSIGRITDITKTPSTPAPPKIITGLVPGLKTPSITKLTSRGRIITDTPFVPPKIGIPSFPVFGGVSLDIGGRRRRRKARKRRTRFKSSVAGVFLDIKAPKGIGGKVLTGFGIRGVKL
tara:strand:- start:828 stop:3506 length:2679 start_codon:yes stop_codon:yes gene_type:complete